MLRRGGGGQRGCFITQHRLPITGRKVGRGRGPASKSSADLRDHATKSLVVLNSPVGLEISL